METASHQVLTKMGSTNKTNSYKSSSWSERRRRIRILVYLVIVTCMITSLIQLRFNSTFTRTYSDYDNIVIDSNYSTASASGSPSSYKWKTLTSSTSSSSSSSSPFLIRNVTITNETNIIKDDNDNALAWQKRHKPLQARIDFVVAGFSKCGTTTLLRRLSDVPQIFMGGDIDTETNETIGVHEVHNLQNLGNKDSLKELKDFFRRFSILNITRGTNLTATQLQAQSQSQEQEVNTDTDADSTNTSTTTTTTNSISFLKPVVGFKAPRVIVAESTLLHAVKIFPSIDMMISVRHPVLHFQSNYNFKYRFANETLLQQPNSRSLIGNCGGECSIYRKKQKPYLKHCLPPITFTTKEGWIQTRSDVCTLTSTFHYALSRLGLTPLTSKTEWELLDHHPWSIISGWKGRLFLMETAQLADGDNGHTDRLGQWERQVEDFLGIEPHSFNSTKPLTEEKEGEETPWPRFMNICDEEHGELRAYLLEIGEKSATWIKTYLMQALLEKVVIPNRQHFLELLDKWSIDPC